MSKLSIFYPLVTVENPSVLRKKSEPLHVFDTEVEDFADVLLALMYEYDGIGLSAPQLGENIRMVAVTQRKETPAKNGKRKAKNEKVKRDIIG